MGWLRKKLRGNTVFARVDESGAFKSDESGRVEIVYKLSDSAKIYRASQKNLEATGDPDDEKPIEHDIASPPKERVPTTEKSIPLSSDAVVIYTDGACTGNPGPMGIGAVIMDGTDRVEIGEYIGEGTNNIAELTAIQKALQSLSSDARQRSVVVHTDSSYCIGVLSKGWKAKANVELIKGIKDVMKKVPKLSFVKVKGHAGIPENERCDELATSAIADRRRAN